MEIKAIDIFTEAMCLYAHIHKHKAYRNNDIYGKR